MLLTRSNSIAIGARKRTLSRQVVLGPISIRFLTILLLGVALLFYLIQSSAQATKGFRLSELEREKEKIAAEKERLEMEAARLRSLNQIKEETRSLNLEPIKTKQINL